MSPISLALLVLVVAVASAQVAVPSRPTLPLIHADNSLEVEKHYNPTVVALEHGQHKLSFKNDAGLDACLVCQPFQGCGCSDVAAIRCELKRLKQKLIRLQTLADPHHPVEHHGIPVPVAAPVAVPHASVGPIAVAPPGVHLPPSSVLTPMVVPLPPPSFVAHPVVNHIPVSIMPPMHADLPVHQPSLVGVEGDIRTEYACEGSTLHIQCGVNSRIHIVSANYGRLDKKICNVNKESGSAWKLPCIDNESLSIVRNQCMHATGSCSIPSINNLFADPCINVPKYLEVQYRCTHTVPVVHAPIHK